MISLFGSATSSSSLLITSLVTGGRSYHHDRSRAKPERDCGAFSLEQFACARNDDVAGVSAPFVDLDRLGESDAPAIGGEDGVVPGRAPARVPSCMGRGAPRALACGGPRSLGQSSEAGLDKAVSCSARARCSR